MVTIATHIHAPSILMVEGGRDSDEGAFDELLTTAGYNVYSVTSGESALEEYSVRQPDLVLLDVDLPGIDGIETCRRLRTRHGEACAPIIFMKNGWELADDDASFPAGPVDFLAEPFVSRQALLHIRTHLETRRLAIHQQKLVAELRQASAGKDRLLSMCAHDLRNPLSAVSGLADFLTDPSIGSLNPEQTELVDSIREACQSMLKLVNQLLDFSSVETGELRLELAPASLRDFAERAVFLAAVIAARKGTRIVLQQASPDPVLMMDVMRIREVVDNLISNAVKYSPPGSCIHVMIESLPASPESVPQVRFSVRDQGPGVPAAERHRLFREFSRLSTCPTGGEKSTGLGLAICRKIIDLHGGHISSENQPEGGCVFSFTLPISPCN